MTQGDKKCASQITPSDRASCPTIGDNENATNNVPEHCDILDDHKHVLQEKNILKLIGNVLTRALMINKNKFNNPSMKCKIGKGRSQIKANILNMNQTLKKHIKHQREATNKMPTQVGTRPLKESPTRPTGPSSGGTPRVGKASGRC